MVDKKEEKDIDFNSGIERLEEIVDSLEGGEIDLEESLKVFEEGIKISKRLSEKLGKAEKQIRKLVEKSDSELGTEVMEDGED
jgi:exodeoxyribonuclease VII small subunit